MDVITNYEVFGVINSKMHIVYSTFEANMKFCSTSEQVDRVLDQTEIALLTACNIADDILDDPEASTLRIVRSKFEDKISDLANKRKAEL